MYPTTKAPGYGSFVKNVADGLEERGIRITQISVIRGRGKNFILKVFKYLKFFISILFNFFHSYDFIYIHFPNQAIPLLSFLYKFRKVPIIINYHGEDLIYNDSGYSLFLGKLTEKFVKRYATAVVVPSVYFKNIVISRSIISEDKIIVSPSGGINRVYFHPKKYANINTNLHLGYVGRLEEDKGIFVFLNTCRELKKHLSYKATVIGYGSCYDKTKEFISENQLENHIELIPGVAQSRLGDYYRDFDLLIFCSCAKTGESLGLTGLESMACGTPVVGSDIGGISSYIKEEYNGWLVEKGNINQIVERIMKYTHLSLSDKNNMREACIKTVKPYYSDVVISNLAATFLNIHI